MKAKIHPSVKAHRLFNLRSVKFAIYLSLVTIVILLLGTKGIRDEGTVALSDDMPRYLMNGVYFHDLIRDFPITHPITYTYQYYARYPALSLGHHPLLLGVAQVPFYTIFGISVSSARLTILCFMLLAGIVWFRLLRSMMSTSLSFRRYCS